MKSKNEIYYIVEWNPLTSMRSKPEYKYFKENEFEKAYEFFMKCPEGGTYLYKQECLHKR